MFMSKNSNILEILDKPGINHILHVIQYSPKQYTFLKKQTNENMSARTLDQRLKLLNQNGIIKKEKFGNNAFSNIEYQLTLKGMVVQSVFHAFQQSSLENFDKDFILNYQTKIQQLKKYSWDRIWPLLKKNALKNNKIETLSSSQKINEIIDISTKGITVQTEKSTKMISILKIRQAWDNLVHDGILYRNDHEKSTYRSSFVFALFTLLPFIIVNPNPPLSIKLVIE